MADQGQVEKLDAYAVLKTYGGERRTLYKVGEGWRNEKEIRIRLFALPTDGELIIRKFDPTSKDPEERK